jgi:hypothetical protein
MKSGVAEGLARIERLLASRSVEEIEAAERKQRLVEEMMGKRAAPRAVDVVDRASSSSRKAYPRKHPLALLEGGTGRGSSGGARGYWWDDDGNDAA